MCGNHPFCCSFFRSDSHSRTLAQDPRAQMWKLNFVRSALNFTVILWFSQTRGCLLRQSVSPLLSTIVEFLLQERSHSLPLNILGDAILTASSAARSDPSWTDEKPESIWQLAMTSPSSNLAVACKLWPFRDHDVF